MQHATCWYTVVQSVVYLLRPQLQVEGSYPIIVPLYDKERNLITEIFTAVIFIVNEQRICVLEIL